MWIQQVFVACLCVLLGLQQITAVVNNGQKQGAEPTFTNETTISANNSSSSTSDSSTSSTTVTDSVAESSEQKNNRREAPLGLSDSYGAPIPSNSYGAPPLDSYVPSLPSNIGLPVPVYGVPDGPSNNIVYPALPPDIPPPLSHLPNAYGPPKDIYGPPQISLPPPKYGPPPILSRPQKPFNFQSFSLPKPIYGPPSFGPPLRPPKPSYGPPKLPKPIYGPPLKLPKPHYGPPKPIYLPSKPLNSYGPPIEFLNPPKEIYGPPKNTYGPPKGTYGVPAVSYGPPAPIPHGPPHPGAPAPPTPPDIKYDGWQPIPGLVSRPPSGSYGVPKGQPHGISDLQFTDLVPPPSGGHGSGLGGLAGLGGGHGSGLAGFGGLGGGHGLSGAQKGLSDSYGAPLNTVTGSGGIISTSGDHHGHRGLSGGGHGGGGSGLSVVKSIGYEISPTGIHAFGGGGGGGFGSGGGHLADSYSSPPLNSYSSSGPYAAAHSYKSNEISSFASLDNFANLVSSFETTLGGVTGFGGHGFSTGTGLIPPSGVYGVPPSGKYGTPLLQPPSNKYGAPPKHPVMFREPVPPGLLESIGNNVAQKDAHGIIDNAYTNNYAGPAYVPPPVPDVSKPVKEEEPTGPSNLFSLPSQDPASFQSYVHGSSSAGLNAGFNFNGATAAALTSYTAPLGTVDGSYGLPQANNFGVGTVPQHVDASAFGTATNNFGALSGSYGVPFFGAYQNAGHDCSQHSQPLPQLTYGVPAVNSYTAALSSLNTNIAGAYQGPPPPALNYGVPDLQTAHSQSTDSVSGSNSNQIEDEASKYEEEVNGKSLAENFAPGSELIKSQSIDLNNIPLQGALGSYTLQIQSANGPGGANAVPHDQVLNDGLLQSILNAIEQPKQNTAAILSQPLLHLQQVPPPTPVAIPSGADQIYEASENSDEERSATKNIVVTPPPLQSTPSDNTEKREAEPTQQTESDKETSLPLIDSNEIALYFSNNAEAQSAQGGSDDNSRENKDVEGSDVRNGQQYGSYVSFRTPNSSYVYGDLKPTNVTLQEETTSPEVKT